MKTILLALRRRCAGLLVLTLACLLGMASPALAINITVTSAADSGPGTLRQAISASAPGGTIDFDPALNGQTITLTSAQLGIGRDLTINGPGLDKLTISGNDQFRIFEIASGKTVNISGLTLSHGKAQGADGANLDYICRYDSPIHQYPSAVDPTPGGVATGGAINNAGNLTLANCRIEKCSANGGKGGDSPFTSAACNGPGTDEDVYADAAAGGSAKGGAIYNNGVLNIIGCILSNNSAHGGRGGWEAMFRGCLKTQFRG